MKPVFKWSGGKTDEIKKFKHFYPENFSLFIEPFFGGGAVFFDLLSNNNIINDIHPESVNLLKQIQLGFSVEIYRMLKEAKNEEDYYYKIRDSFKPSNEIEEAFRFYYLRKTCFRGMLRYNKKGHFNIPYGRYKNFNFEELLDTKYEEVLKKTVIYNTDFQEIFEKYNDKENFVFLDPPYDSEFTDYGYCSFGKEDHIRLAQCFKETKNQCLLVIGETPFIKDLYEDYIVDVYAKKYAFKIHSGRVGKEIDNNHLVIKNY